MTAITPEFAFMAQQHLRQRNAVAGIDWLTLEEEALLDVAQDRQHGEIARGLIAAELKQIIDNGRFRIQEILAEAETADDKTELLNEARDIEENLTFALEMLEIVNSGPQT